MPSKTKKQQNYFRLVKAYKDGGYKDFFSVWRDIFGKRSYPPSDYINKVIEVSKKIKQADLEDLASGVEGQPVVGDVRDIKVGYWALFKGKYKDSKGQVQDGKFISRIKRVDHNNRIANFSIYDFYNRFGAKIEVPRRLSVTHPEFQWLDYAYFKDILKTGKDKKDVTELRPGTLMNEVFGDESFWDYTGALAETGSEGRQTWPEMLAQTIGVYGGNDLSNVQRKFNRIVDLIFTFKSATPNQEPMNESSFKTGYPTLDITDLEKRRALENSAQSIETLRMAEFFINKLDGCEIITDKRWPDSTFYRKNGVVLFEKDVKNKHLYVNYHRIWRVFELNYSQQYSEIQSLMRNVLEGSGKFIGFTPGARTQIGGVHWKVVENL